MNLRSRHLWIAVGFVIVYLVLPSLRIDLSLTAIAAAFVVFLAISLLVDALHARQRAAAREKAASDPALRQLSVFVGGYDGQVYALGASDGSIRWRAQTGAGSDDAPVSPPTHRSALAAHDGTRLWSYETGRPVGSSPVALDGMLFVGSDDHHVYALNARDGSLMWQHKTGERISTAPAVANEIVYVASEDQFLYAFDARSGKVRWRFQTGGGRSSPVVVDGVVYVGSGGLGRYQERASKPALFEQGNVWALRAGDGKLLWRSYLGTLSAAATPVVANGVVVVSTSGFSSPSYTCVHAFDAKSGQLLWQSPAGIGGEYGVGVAMA